MDVCQLFDNLCAVKKCFKDHFVLEALKASVLSGILDLSGFSVNTKLCEVLECALLKVEEITKIKLCDCMISAEGFEFIINALLHHPNVTEVNLYGNNIKADVTRQLGKLLAVNSKIKVLVLNWNNMGDSLADFSVFCDGLSKNESLEYLDLRNNQLGSGCGPYLAAALLENHSLKIIDLRWNKLQNEGIESLQGALKQNKTLFEIHLKGNFAQSNVSSEIEEQAKRNEEIKALKIDYESKIAFLLKEVKKLEEGRFRQITKITDLAHHKIIELEQRVGEVMDKLLSKDELLKNKEEEKKCLENDILLEKEKRIEIMEELEIIKKINLDLKENLRIKEIELHDILKSNETVLTMKKEENVQIQKLLNEKDNIIDEMKAHINCLNNKWENLLKNETDSLENLWKTRLEEVEVKLRETIEHLKSENIKAQETLLVEKGKEVETLQETINRMSSEKMELENEVVKWQTSTNYLQIEISELKKSMSFISDHFNTVMKELKNEKLRHKKLRDEKKIYIEEITNLNDLVNNLKTDLTHEKEKGHKISQKLHEADNRLSLLRQEEKIRSELLTSALKRYLSMYDDSTLV